MFIQSCGAGAGVLSFNYDVTFKHFISFVEITVYFLERWLVFWKKGGSITGKVRLQMA